MVWRPTTLTRSQMEQRRLDCAAMLVEQSPPVKQLAEHFGVSRSSIYNWIRQFKSSGLDGLKARKAAGRSRQLTEDQEQQVKADLQQEATLHGFPDPTWTAPRVRDLIGLKFGVWYHIGHVYKLLVRLGFSYQKPDKRAIERNDARIHQWVQAVIPEILNKVQQNTTLVFLDESGFSLKTTTRKTWALKGKTPQVTCRTNWEKLSVIGAITSQGKFYQHTKEGAFKGEGVAQFLRHLLKQIAGNLVIIMDNGGIHKTAAVKKVLEDEARLKIEYLPPYAPELNPIERIWAYVKKHVLGNRLCKTVPELRTVLTRAWTRVRRLDLKKMVASDPWKALSG